MEEERLKELELESQRLDERKKSALSGVAESPRRAAATKPSPRKKTIPRKEQEAPSSASATTAEIETRFKEEDAAGSELTGESLVRFLRAQLNASRKESSRNAAAAEQATKRAEAAEEQAKQLATAAKELQAASGAAAIAAEKAEKAKSSAIARCEAAELELAGLRAKAEGGARSARQAQKDSAAAEEKLRAAGEEIGRLRAESERAALLEAERDRLREAVDRLALEVRSLEKQRTDLVSAFRAQAKLVDVLKRQKAHLESAKLLEISEQDFVRAISLPSSSGDV